MSEARLTDDEIDRLIDALREAIALYEMTPHRRSKARAARKLLRRIEAPKGKTRDVMLLTYAKR